ncbi:MAG: nuclear transport factor 2 family protein [Rhodobacteraceae bacterium]|nr:nuclear transport factor 2 family protein [Paracoccaceae bacterium]
MTKTKKDQIRALLKSIETGEPEPIAVVNEAKYIQHNPQTHEGSEGLAALFKRLSKTSPRVNIVRAFEDGEFVFAHTEYDFAARNIGFEVFRFEDGRAVEHWDNIQRRKGPNQAGHSMVDGQIESTDLGSTEINRAIVRDFIETVFIGGEIDQLPTYIDEDLFVDHNPLSKGGLNLVRTSLQTNSDGSRNTDYRKVHRVLAEGSFVLCISEGNRDGVHSSFYDLFRLHENKLVEHWDTTEKIAPKSEWKNSNGKF